MKRSYYLKSISNTPTRKNISQFQYLLEKSLLLSLQEQGVLSISQCDNALERLQTQYNRHLKGEHFS